MNKIMQKIIKKIMQKISLKQTRLFALIALLSGFVAAMPALGKEGDSAGVKACAAAAYTTVLSTRKSFLKDFALCRAEQGHAKAQFFLGMMYYKGQGVAQNDA